MEIYCRSTKEIMETAVCALHTQVCEDLRTWFPGGYLFRGKARDELELLLKQLEDAILSDEPGMALGGLTRRYQSIMRSVYMRSV